MRDPAWSLGRRIATQDPKQLEPDGLRRVSLGLLLWQDCLSTYPSPSRRGSFKHINLSLLTIQDKILILWNPHSCGNLKGVCVWSAELQCPYTNIWLALISEIRTLKLAGMAWHMQNLSAYQMGTRTGNWVTLPSSMQSCFLTCQLPYRLYHRGTRQKGRSHQPLRSEFCKGGLAARLLHLIPTGVSVGNMCLCQPLPNQNLWTTWLFARLSATGEEKTRVLRSLMMSEQLLGFGIYFYFFARSSGLHPQHHINWYMPHSHYPSIWGVEVGGAEVQGHSQLCSKLGASLRNNRFCLKERKEKSQCVR